MYSIYEKVLKKCKLICMPFHKILPLLDATRASASIVGRTEGATSST